MIKLKSLLSEKYLGFGRGVGHVKEQSMTDLAQGLDRDGQDGPFYRDGLSFPNPSDASSVVGDMKSFEDWKQETKRRYGNVKVILDPNAKEHWEKVQVDDARFTQDKKQADDAKMNVLQQFGTTE